MWPEQMLHKRQAVSSGSLFQEGNCFAIQPAHKPLLEIAYTQYVGDNLP